MFANTENNQQMTTPQNFPRSSVEKLDAIRKQRNDIEKRVVRAPLPLFQFEAAMQEEGQDPEIQQAIALAEQYAIQQAVRPPAFRQLFLPCTSQTSPRSLLKKGPDSF